MKFLYVLAFAALPILAYAAVSETTEIITPPPSFAPSNSRNDSKNPELVTIDIFIEMANNYNLVEHSSKKYTYDDVVDAASLMGYVAGVADSLGVHPKNVGLGELTDKVIKNINKNKSPNENVVSVLRAYSRVVSDKTYFSERLLIESELNMKRVVSGQEKGPTATTVKQWVIVFSVLHYTDAVIVTNNRIFGMKTTSPKGECSSDVGDYLLSMAARKNKKFDDPNTPANQIVNKVCF